MLVYQRFAKYGVATTIYFSLEDGSSTTDAYIGVDIVGADSTISKDGGAATTTTNAVSTTRSPFFSIALTATEMQASRLQVRLNDASAAVFKDAVIFIETKLQLGQIDADATQIGGNTSGITSTGVGSGYGLSLAGASTAFLTNLFGQLEGTEPSGFPADNATVMAILQFVKRRFSNKRTQTSTTFTQYKDDSATSCWVATVADDGTTQTVGKGA